MKRLELVESRRIRLASEVGQNRGGQLRRPKTMRMVDPSNPSTGVRSDIGQCGIAGSCPLSQDAMGLSRRSVD